MTTGWPGGAEAPNLSDLLTADSPKTRKLAAAILMKWREG